MGFWAFLFLFFVFFDVFPGGKGERRLKLRVLFHLPQSHKVHIAINAKFNSGNEIFGSKILSGKDIDFEVPPNGEKTEKIVLRFLIAIMPNENEGEPNERENNWTANTAQNNRQNRSDILRRKSMAQRRKIEVTLHKPNFSKRYVVNVGSLAVTDIFWHQKIFYEAENGEENPPENLHAFLYATVQKNGNYEEEKLLGYAPVVLRNDGAEMPTNGNRDGTDGQQHTKLLEYTVKIPIDLRRMFKRQILELSIYLYRFNEKEFKKTEKGNGEVKDKETNVKNERDLSDEICAICLDPLSSQGKEKQNFHLTKGKNHEFHRICIKKWIEHREKVHCPLCNKEAQLIFVGVPLPIFSTQSDVPLALYSNALAQLYNRAQNADNSFAMAQSQCALASIVQKIHKYERHVHNLLANFHPSMAQIGHNESLFGIERGTFVVNDKLMQLIQNVQKNPQIITEQQDKLRFNCAIDLIKTAELYQSSEANVALENMQLISEETEDDAANGTVNN